MAASDSQSESSGTSSSLGECHRSSIHFEEEEGGIDLSYLDTGNGPPNGLIYDYSMLEEQLSRPY